MILSTTIKVKSSNWYRELGYDITDKYIFVNIKDVPLGSRAIILTQCDYCQSKRELAYKNYNDNIKRGGKYACSVKCGVLKAKESNLQNLGVESFFQSQSFKEKAKKTLLEKWGVTHISKSESISDRKSQKMKEKSEGTSHRVKQYHLNLSVEERAKINIKRENTNLERWGQKWISQVDSIKEKIKQTNLEKWGGFTFDSMELREKVRQTNLERWGCEIPSKSDLVKKKTTATNFRRWGYKSPSMTEVVKNKTRNTLLEKYNVINIMFSTEFRSKFKITAEAGWIRYLGTRNYEFFCEVCRGNYDIDYDNYYKRKLRGVSTCTGCFPILENSSIKEKELANFISSIYTNKIINSYRDGLEIDIYLPELGIGFEFNGLYWHSEEKLDRNYHLNKTNYFKERGIRIIHIWEDLWDFKREIIKSQITNWICGQKKIFARKCVVKQIIQSREATQFLTQNHIQGGIRSMIKLGLYYEGELVSIMTFDNSEGRKKMETGAWNLSRFCSKINTNVTGAASKLLKYFVDNWQPKRIISFSDKDWSTGNLYYGLGFTLVGDLKPDYKYIIDHQRVNKQRLTKKKLISRGQDPKLSESQIIAEMNINKIYNVGQLKFELNF